MLWAVRHECPSGAQFTFNCYRHWATLVVRDIGDGSGHFLHSKEGVTQGDPLAMIAYGIGVLPLIRELREAHPALHILGMLITRGQGRRSLMCRRTFRPAGAGTGPGVLPRADQEYLGRVPRERRPG